jgi:hypothetical protein
VLLPLLRLRCQYATTLIFVAVGTWKCRKLARHSCEVGWKSVRSNTNSSVHTHKHTYLHEDTMKSNVTRSCLFGTGSDSNTDTLECFVTEMSRKSTVTPRRRREIDIKTILNKMWRCGLESSNSGKGPVACFCDQGNDRRFLWKAGGNLLAS